MKKQEMKQLQGKLLLAINKVLKNNNSDLSDKVNSVVKKSIKSIVKKTDKQIKKALRLE